jgi:hypothetical protein
MVHGGCVQGTTLSPWEKVQLIPLLQSMRQEAAEVGVALMHAPAREKGGMAVRRHPCDEVRFTADPLSEKGSVEGRRLG